MAVFMRATVLHLRCGVKHQGGVVVRYAHRDPCELFVKGARMELGTRHQPDQAAGGQAKLPLRKAGCMGQGVVRRLDNGTEIARLLPTVLARELPRHTHDEAHLVLILRGRYLTSAAGGSSKCVAGTLIYNPPGTTHRDRFHDLDGEFVTMKIPEPLRQQWNHGLDQGAIQLGRQAQAFAFGITRAAATWQGDDEQLAEVLLGEMLAEIAGTSDEPADWPGWLPVAEAWLADNHDAAADMRLMAKACGVHPVHLARVFRRRHGCTPIEYSRRLRLARAAICLREALMPIADIAAAFGFADQSHFHRHFSRMYGQSPAAYRLSC
jgi:AraC family transcriptional regulator